MLDRIIRWSVVEVRIGVGEVHGYQHVCVCVCAGEKAGWRKEENNVRAEKKNGDVRLL